MLEKAKEILYNIPYSEVEDFYISLVGETCGNGMCEDCRNHIYAKLRRAHRWYKYKTKVNKDKIIICYIIRLWLNVMSEKYNIGVKIKIPKIE